LSDLDIRRDKLRKLAIKEISEHQNEHGEVTIKQLLELILVELNLQTQLIYEKLGD
jgi:hypothetical protein